MKFHAFAQSLLGPKYEAKGWQCQDSSAYKGFGQTQIIVVADGHGSADCFRSEHGSKLAVKAAIKTTEEFVEGFSAADELSDENLVKFKFAVWNEWRNLVKKDWNDRKNQHQLIGEGELRFDSVSDKYKSRYTSTDEAIVEQYLYNAYGTTLLFAVNVKSKIMIFQIGDGTGVIFTRAGQFEVPVSADEDNQLNVTVSLCDENAYKKIRHKIIEYKSGDDHEPIALFLSSDGVDDCYPVFENERHLYKLYALIIENIIQNNFEETFKEISSELLPGLTAKVSQDDISLALFVSQTRKTLKKAYTNSLLKPLV